MAPIFFTKTKIRGLLKFKIKKLKHRPPFIVADCANFASSNHFLTYEEVKVFLKRILSYQTNEKLDQASEDLASAILRANQLLLKKIEVEYDRNVATKHK